MSKLLKQSVSADTQRELIDKYGFNPALLSNFYATKMTEAKMKSGGGGCQILFLGDSTFAGTDVTNRNVNSIPGVVRRVLRNEFEQTSGCVGFVPCRYQSSAVDSNPATVATTGSRGAPTNIASYTATGSQGYVLPSSATATPTAISFTFTGATRAPQIVHIKNAGVTGATQQGTWTLTSILGFSASGTYTFRDEISADYEGAIRSLTGVSVLDKDDTYTLTIAGLASDGGVSSPAWISGILTYGDEWNSGIRVHNIACTGTTLYDDDAVPVGLGMYRSDDDAGIEAILLYNNVTIFCSSSSATSGSAKTDLVVCNWGLNDQGHYGTTIANSYGNIGAAEVATAKNGYDVYLSYLCRFIEDLKNQTSRPDVLMVDMPISEDRGPQLRLFQLAKRNACDIMGAAYINLSKIYTPGERSITMASAYDADSIHMTAAGYGQMGTDIAQCLYSGYLWYKTIGSSRTL